MVEMQSETKNSESSICTFGLGMNMYCEALFFALGDGVWTAYNFGLSLYIYVYLGSPV